MKSCRLPVAVIYLLVVVFTAGGMIRAAQAAPLNQAHPDPTKIQVCPERPVKSAYLRLQISGKYDKIYKAWLGSA